jgi:MFS family permease
MGALSAGPVAGRYGRRRAMQLTTFFFALGPVFEALAPNIGVMAFGRVISGVGAGASVVVVPIYISEIAPPAEKGFFGSFTQVMCNVGILIAQLLGYFLSRKQQWRWIMAAGGAIGVAQSFGLLLSVESPKYLADQGEPIQAKRILRKIRGKGVDIEEEVSGWGVESSEDINGMRPYRVAEASRLTPAQTRSRRCCRMRITCHSTMNMTRLSGRRPKRTRSASSRSSVTLSTRRR